MRQQFGDITPSKNLMSKWWTRFTNGNYGTEDMPRSPTTVDRQGILDALDDEPTSSLRDLKVQFTIILGNPD
ncbi:unnamed protein product [Haemonchus placei]|uniref:HTH_48 domain-containing protein n=1 Tax=Haemonchus placei TaxID=6290 RepID=A0A0N4WD49_HAEPC|nr:unnamed protein product [Haemonchus placei]